MQFRIPHAQRSSPRHPYVAANPTAGAVWPGSRRTSPRPLGPAFVAVNPTVPHWQCRPAARSLGPAFVAANSEPDRAVWGRHLLPGFGCLGSPFIPSPCNVTQDQVANYPLARRTTAALRGSRTARQANRVHRPKPTIIHVTVQFVDPSSESVSTSASPRALLGPVRYRPSRSMPGASPHCSSLESIQQPPLPSVIRQSDCPMSSVVTFHHRTRLHVPPNPVKILSVHQHIALHDPAVVLTPKV
jgi:hypothetical protein